MLPDRPTSEQIAANEARISRAIVILIVSLVLLIAAIALLMLAARTNRIPLWLFNGGGAALFIGWLAYVVILTKPPLNIDPSDEAYLRQTIDIQQRRGRYLLSLLLVTLFWTGSVLTNAFIKGREGPLFALVAGTFALNALLAILNLNYGQGFLLRRYRRAVTDELNRAQRARAAQIGFILAVLEMCAILIAAAYHPHWGLVSLPLAIAAAIALPCFYFMYLEWRSDRG